MSSLKDFAAFSWVAKLPGIKIGLLEDLKAQATQDAIEALWQFARHKIAKGQESYQGL